MTAAGGDSEEEEEEDADDDCDDLGRAAASCDRRRHRDFRTPVFEVVARVGAMAISEKSVLTS